MGNEGACALPQSILLVTELIRRSLTALWLVRARRHGEHEHRFLDEGRIERKRPK